MERIQRRNVKEDLNNLDNHDGVTTRRNINNLRYADDTTLMTESEKELKSLLMKVKEEREKAGLKLNIRIWLHHLMVNRWGNSGNSG